MTLPQQIARHIRTLSDAISKAANMPIANAPGLSMFWGTVDTIDAGTPNTLHVFISGALTSVGNISYSGQYVPTVGDYVYGFRYGKDYVVEGGMSGTTMGTRIPISWAILGPLTAGTYPGLFVPSGGGQSFKLYKARAKLSSGTVTATIRNGGSNVTGFTSLSVTTGATSYTPTAVAFSGDDDIDLVLSSPSGTGDLTFTGFAALAG
jgi:hypothetical protein